MFSGTCFQKRAPNYLIPRLLQLKTKGYNEIKHLGPFPKGEGLLAWGRRSCAETPLFSQGWGLIANWEPEWGIYISRKCQGFVIFVKINLWLPSPSGRGHSQSVGRDVFLHAFQLLFWEVAVGRGFKLNWGVFRLPYHTSFISGTEPRALWMSGMCSITEL